MTVCKNTRCRKQSMGKCLLKKDPSKCEAGSVYNDLLAEVIITNKKEKKKP